MFNNRRNNFNNVVDLPNFGFSTGPSPKNNRNQRNQNQGAKKNFGGGNNNTGGYGGGQQFFQNNFGQPQNYGNQPQNNYGNPPQNNYGNQRGNQRKQQMQNGQQQQQQQQLLRNQGGPRNQNLGGQNNQNQRGPRKQNQQQQNFGGQPNQQFQQNYGNQQQQQQPQNGYVQQGGQQNNQGFNPRKRKSNTNIQNQGQNQRKMANNNANLNNQNCGNANQQNQQFGGVRQQRQSNPRNQNNNFGGQQGGNQGPNESDALLKELGKCLLGSITGNPTGANPVLQNQVMGLINRPAQPPMPQPALPMYPTNFNGGPLLPGPLPMGFGPNGPNFGPSGPNFGPNGPNFGPNGPNFGPNSRNFGPNSPRRQMGPRKQGQQGNKNALRANNKRELKPKSNDKKTVEKKQETKTSAIQNMINSGKDIENDEIFVPLFLRKVLYSIIDQSFKTHANFLVHLFYARPNSIKLLTYEIKRFLDLKIGDEKENIKAKKEILLKAKAKFVELCKEKPDLIKSKEEKMNELIDILSGEKFTDEHQTKLDDYRFDETKTREDYEKQLKYLIIRFLYEKLNIKFKQFQVKNFQKYVDYTMQNKIIPLFICDLVQNKKQRTTIPKNLQKHLQYSTSISEQKQRSRKPCDGYFFTKLMKNVGKVKTEISDFISAENPLSTEALRDFAECLLKFDEKVSLAKLKVMYFTPNVVLNVEEKINIFDQVVKEIYSGCIECLNNNQKLFEMEFPPFVEDKEEKVEVKTEENKVEVKMEVEEEAVEVKEESTEEKK